MGLFLGKYKGISELKLGSIGLSLKEMWEINPTFCMCESSFPAKTN